MTDNEIIEEAIRLVEVGGELCFVPQGNALISGTIRYNLQQAKPDATEDELREVLQYGLCRFRL